MYRAIILFLSALLLTGCSALSTVGAVADAVGGGDETGNTNTTVEAQVGKTNEKSTIKSDSSIGFSTAEAVNINQGVGWGTYIITILALLVFNVITIWIGKVQRRKDDNLEHQQQMQEMKLEHELERKNP